jgi:hypothetical protein
MSDMPTSEVAAGSPPARQSSRTTEIRLATLLVIFSHACDALSTYIQTPDLRDEAGPLYVRLAELGYGGWPLLLGMKAFVCVLSMGLLALYVAHRRSFYPSEPGMSFHQFLHYTHGKDALHWKNGYWLAPSPRLIAIWMAYIGAIGSALYALALALTNTWYLPAQRWLQDSPAAAPLAAVIQRIGPEAFLRGLEGAVMAAVFLATAALFWQALYRDYRRCEG